MKYIDTLDKKNRFKLVKRFKLLKDNSSGIIHSKLSNHKFTSSFQKFLLKEISSNNFKYLLLNDLLNDIGRYFNCKVYIQYQNRDLPNVLNLKDDFTIKKDTIYYLKNIDDINCNQINFLRHNNASFIIELNSNLHNIKKFRILNIKNSYNDNLDENEIINLWSILNYNSIFVN